jgi:hypothetical protein
MSYIDPNHRVPGINGYLKASNLRSPLDVVVHCRQVQHEGQVRPPYWSVVRTR